MLKKLESFSAVSGAEEDVRAFLIDCLNDYCDTIRVDKMGNLHAIKHGCGPKFTLFTYMDEPGIIVTQITEEGYLKFETIGRIESSSLVSKRVFLDSKIGVISLKAIHLTTPKEREIPVTTEQLFIDIGASSKEEAEKLVDIGDYGSLDIPYTELYGASVKGRAIAGRMGCAVAVELLKKSHCNIHVVFSVQREVGCRGIVGCKSVCKGDYTIVFDGIDAKDYFSNNEYAPEAGKGVVIVSKYPGGMIDKKLQKLCQSIATEHNIAIQCGMKTKQGMEDAIVQDGEQRIISLSIPVRYSYSVSPVAHLDDMNGMLCLTDALIKKLIKEEEKC